MNPLPITPPATSHPRGHRQGPLDYTWWSLHRHCHRHPPLPSLSATAAIITIWGWLLLGATCHHLHSHPSRPMPPQPYQQRNRCHLTPVLLPPPLLSHPLCPLDPPWRHLGPACGVDALWYDVASAAPARAPLFEKPDNCTSAAVTAAAIPQSPLRLLGPPPSVRQW